MQCIARGDLLRLGGQRVLLPHQCDAQSFALLGGPFQHAGFDHCSSTVRLADRRVECNLSVESRARANHAVPAQHPGLDKLPVLRPTMSEMIPLCGKYTRSIV